MNGLLEKLPTVDEIAAERRRRAESRVSKVSPAEPEAWFKEVLGVKRLYPKQLAMVEAVRDCDQVSVSGCNSSGKDWTAARIALWWMAYHKNEPAKVVITAPTHRQIGDIVWQELRTAYLGANADLGGTLYQTPLLRWSEERFIIGFSTDKPYQVQGFHSPNLLIILSEAHGIDQAHIDALWRLNPNRMLMTGNPISESGEFFESHHGKANLWQTIDINAYDTPNVIEGKEVIPGLVTLEDIERGRRNWGEDNPLFRITFLNEWVEGMGSLVVVPLSLALKAEQNHYEPGLVEVVSCDVAEGVGRDWTVIRSRRGRVSRLIWRSQNADTMVTAGVLKEYYDRHKFAHFVVDGVGVGIGVVHRCRELGMGIIDFRGGAGADDPSQFVDKNAEVWWRMRNAYISGIDVEEDRDLRSEVSSRAYHIQSDKRVQLESKEAMRKLGKHSPDNGDSLAMTFVLDYNLDGAHLSAESDVSSDRPMEEQPETLGFGKEYQRPSLARGTNMSPFAGSRWGRSKRR